MVSSTDRPAWLEARRKVVTASEISALFDCGWVDEDGLLQQKLSGSQIQETPAMYWGRKLERVNFDAFTETEGLTGFLNTEFRTKDSLGATIDGVIHGMPLPKSPIRIVQWVNDPIFPSEGKPVALELKNTDKKYMKEPYPHYLQLQCGMGVWGLQVGYLVTKMGASTMRAWCFEFDPILFDEMQERAAKFLRRLEMFK